MNIPAFGVILLGCLALALYAWGCFMQNRAENLAQRNDVLHEVMATHLVATAALLEQCEALEVENMRLRATCHYRAELAVMACLHVSGLVERRMGVREDAP